MSNNNSNNNSDNESDNKSDNNSDNESDTYCYYESCFICFESYDYYPNSHYYKIGGSDREIYEDNVDMDYCCGKNCENFICYDCYKKYVRERDNVDKSDENYNKLQICRGREGRRGWDGWEEKKPCNHFLCCHCYKDINKNDWTCETCLECPYKTTECSGCKIKIDYYMKDHHYTPDYYYFDTKHNRATELIRCHNRCHKFLCSDCYDKYEDDRWICNDCFNNSEKEQEEIN